jgi:hypothetical protein
MFLEFALAWVVIVTIPSAILYVVVLIALVYNNKTVPFDSKFFVLWINLGIFALTSTVISWVFTNTWTLGVWPGNLIDVK